MDLKSFKQKTKKDRSPLIRFLKKLDKIVPDDMDQLVQKVDETVWKEADCLSCANCCKTMTPIYTDEDIDRISAHLQLTPKQFKARYTIKENETNSRINSKIPCHFLLPDNACMIYEVRPEDCKEFPHHHKKPFDEYNDTFIQNLDYCPATYNLVERLLKKVKENYEW